MGRRQGYDPSVLHSSIALLQERFRRLERVKEMREERELLKLFNDHDALSMSPSSNLNPNPSYEVQPKWFIHPELVHPALYRQTAIPFRLEFQNSSMDWGKSWAIDTGLSMGLWPDPNVGLLLNKDEDVDTTLHL